jgi:hypothetical protein
MHCADVSGKIHPRYGGSREAGAAARGVSPVDRRARAVARHRGYLRPSEHANKYFEDWRDTTFTKIGIECRQNHGAALKAYLERIVLAEFDVAEFARNAASTFVGHVVESGDGAVARDVAAKFGLVYAGGLLGIRFGIVPWQADELLDAIAKSYRAARDILPDEGVALRKGMAVLSARLGKLRRLKDLKADHSTDWDRIEGYRVRTKHRNRYVIKREVFNAIFATTVQRDLVLRHLIRSEQIKLGTSKGGSGTTDKLKGTSKNSRYRSRATRLSSNDSGLFSFRFVDVHSRTVRDWQRNQFFEVP